MAKCQQCGSEGIGDPQSCDHQQLFGAKLSNNAVVIEHDTKSGIVLAHTGHGPHPFVTWRIWFRDGESLCEVGHYHADLLGAAQDYQARKEGE